MFDSNSFSTESFDNKSWYIQLISAVTRFIVRIASKLSTSITVKSEVS